MTIAYSDVGDVVVAALPEFRHTYAEHLRDHGEVLAHLLFADLTRFTLEAYRRGDTVLVSRVLALMERLSSEGDERVDELVWASFVENISPYEDADERFFSLYGPRLREAHTTVWGKADESTQPWHVVREVPDWDWANDVLRGFHDGVVREIRIKGADEVQPDGSLEYGGFPVASVFVQFQTDVPDAELRFYGVRSLHFDREIEVTPASAVPAKDGTWEVEFLSCRITATECQLR